MKRLMSIAIVMAVVFAFAGCGNGKKKSPTMEFREGTDSTLSNDSTIYGRCGEGTAMHTLELIGDDGKTRHFMINLDDSLPGVHGGLLAGDKMAVIAQVEYGDTFATKVINLTTLQGKWLSIDRNFEIKEGGIIKSHNESESKPWTSWRIYNGHLVLDKDTFDIDELGADSMYLENKDGIFGFKRIK